MIAAGQRPAKPTTKTAYVERSAKLCRHYLDVGRVGGVDGNALGNEHAHLGRQVTQLRQRASVRLKNEELSHTFVR